MTTTVLEQLAHQRQAELAARAARHTHTRQPRRSAMSEGSPRSQSRLVAARLAELVGRS